MPHFGLMDTGDSFETAEGARLRARLHIRSGLRRLRQEKISAGIVTFYDALLFAMRAYVLSPEGKDLLSYLPGDVMGDDRAVFSLLVRSGVLDGSFDYDAFNRIVEEAAERELKDFDFSGLVQDLERVMTRLGVMPFAEESLPPEDPSTF